jgi:hypothetical protein
MAASASAGTASAQAHGPSTVSAAAGQPLELVRYDSSTGRFHVGEAAIAVLRELKGPVSVVAVCGRARQVCVCLCVALASAQPSTPQRAYTSAEPAPTPACCTAGQELHPEPAAAHHGRLHDRQHHAPLHQGALDVEQPAAAAGRRWPPLPYGARAGHTHTHAHTAAHTTCEAAARTTPQGCKRSVSCTRLRLCVPTRLETHTHTHARTRTCTQSQVLLDSEGIDAYDQTAQYSTQVFSLAVLLSSVFVYNQMGGIDEAALDRCGRICSGGGAAAGVLVCAGECDAGHRCRVRQCGCHCATRLTRLTRLARPASALSRAGLASSRR